MSFEKETTSPNENVTVVKANGKMKPNVGCGSRRNWFVTGMPIERKVSYSTIAINSLRVFEAVKSIKATFSKKRPEADEIIIVKNC